MQVLRQYPLECLRTLLLEGFSSYTVANPWTPVSPHTLYDELRKWYLNLSDLIHGYICAHSLTGAKLWLNLFQVWLKGELCRGMWRLYMRLSCVWRSCLGHRWLLLLCGILLVIHSNLKSLSSLRIFPATVLFLRIQVRVLFWRWPGCWQILQQKAVFS